MFNNLKRFKLPLAATIFVFVIGTYLTWLYSSKGHRKASLCFSPFELVRRWNLLCIFTAPLHETSVASFCLNFLSLFLLLEYIRRRVSKFPSQRTLVTFLLLNYVVMLTSLTIFSVIAFYVFKSHSLVISHVFHDCFAGIHVVNIPIMVTLMMNNDTSLLTFDGAYIFLIILIQSWSIYVTPSHLVSSLACIITTSAYSLLYRKLIDFSDSEQKLSLNVKSPLRSADFNHNTKMLFKRVGIYPLKRHHPDNQMDTAMPSISIPVPEIASSSTKTSVWKIEVLLLVCILAFIAARELSLQKELVVSWDAKNEVGLKKEPGLAVLILTKSRPGHPRYLMTTIESFLDELPEDMSKAPKVHLYVISTEPEDKEHVVFNHARDILFYNQAATNFVSFLQLSKEFMGNMSALPESSANSPLRTQVAAALKYISSHIDDGPYPWVMLHEDDFPICRFKVSCNLRWIISHLQGLEDHCGLFAGTGGAGLIIRREVIGEVINALMEPKIDLPSDVTTQNCLRGKLPPGNCDICRHPAVGLSVTSHLLFEHIGFVSSRKRNGYNKSERRWSCGWLHPFNGDPDVEVIHVA